jgi:hypothetical protein
MRQAFRLAANTLQRVEKTVHRAPVIMIAVEHCSAPQKY